MRQPVQSKYKINQGFGKAEFSDERGDEIYYFFGGQHPGLDYHMPVGEPIFAVLPGYVTSIAYHRGMGKVVRVRHGNIQHIYGHLSKFRVDFGDCVEEGQKIAESGDSVSWFGPHLHFEMRDLTVWEVKDRPFQPDFELEVPDQFQEEFTYTVTREQALIDLSLKFFGKEEGVEALRKANLKYSKIHSHTALPEGSKLVIPQILVPSPLHG